MSFKLDLANMKYLKHDAKSTTFQHPAGHTMTIAHNVLSPKNRDLIKTFHKSIDNTRTPVQAEEAQDQVPGKSYAKGGDVLDSGKNGISEQGHDVRQAARMREYPPAHDSAKVYDKFAKDEARGRAKMEKQVRPNIKGLAEGGSPNMSGPGMAQVAESMRGGPAPKPEQKPRPPQPRNDDGEWPLPSTTSVGKAAAAAAAQREEGMAEGGKVSHQRKDVYDRGVQQFKDKMPSPEHQARINERSKLANDIIKSPGPGMRAELPPVRKYAEGSQDVGGEVTPTPYEERDSQDQNKNIGEAVGHAVRVAMSKPQLPIGAPQAQEPVQEDPPDSQQASAQASPQVNDAPVLKPGMPGYEDAPAPEAAPSEMPAAQPQAAQAPVVNQHTANNTNENTMSPMDRMVRDRAIAKQPLQAENAAWEQDLVNGHVTPKTYHDLFAKNSDGSERSTLGKIGSLFSLMVGGAGAGLTHGPNVFLEMMNKEIQNDLNAQIQSKTNAQNFLRLNQANLLNQAQAKNLNVNTAAAAYALAQSQMLQSSFHSLATNVSKLPDGPEKQKSKLALAAMYPQMQEKINNINDLAVSAQEYYNNFSQPNQNANQAANEQDFQNRMAKLKMSGPQGAAMADYKIARHIPGVPGEASRDIPSDKRNLVQAQTILDDKGKQVLDYVKAHRGTWKPSEIAKGEQMVDEMKNFYNSSIEGGALTEGRLSWYDRQFGTGKKDGLGRWIGGSHPTDMFSQLMGSTARMQEMVDSNSRRKDLELKGLGFPTSNHAQPQAASNPATPPSAPEEQLSKSGRPMIKRNGQWYYK